MTDYVEHRFLRAFVAVGEELHFTRAASRLRVTQQALSSQIRQLEHELGVRLLFRTTRKVELSPAGQVLLVHARAILASVEAACQETRRVGRAEHGELRLAYTPTLAAETLPHIAATFHASTPGVRLSTCEMWPHEAARSVADGVYDAGMARHPPLLDGLACRVVRAEPLGVVLGSGHRLARSELVPVDALADSVLAIWPRDVSPGFYDAVAALFPTNLAAGRVYEFENFAHQGFLSDVYARTEIAEGRAFQVAFETQYEPLPPGWIWRPLCPLATIGVHLFYRSGRETPALRALVAAALTTATQRGWLASSLRTSGAD